MLTTSQSNRHKSIADRWSGEPCTLDGEPAKIAGRLCQCATVAPLNPCLPSYHWSWECVGRTMTNSRAFFS